MFKSLALLTVLAFSLGVASAQGACKSYPTAQNFVMADLAGPWAWQAITTNSRFAHAQCLNSNMKLVEENSNLIGFDTYWVDNDIVQSSTKLLSTEVDSPSFGRFSNIFPGEQTQTTLVEFEPNSWAVFTTCDQTTGKTEAWAITTDLNVSQSVINLLRQKIIALGWAPDDVVGLSCAWKSTRNGSSSKANGACKAYPTAQNFTMADLTGSWAWQAITTNSRFAHAQCLNSNMNLVKGNSNMIGFETYWVDNDIVQSSTKLLTTELDTPSFGRFNNIFPGEHSQTTLVEFEPNSWAVFTTCDQTTGETVAWAFTTELNVSQSVVNLLRQKIIALGWAPDDVVGMSCLWRGFRSEQKTPSFLN